MVEEENEEIRNHFLALGGRLCEESGRLYNMAQRDYALSLIDEHGFGATARILTISRMTLYRWCKMYDKVVARVPPWLYDWVEIRRRRKERRERRRYG